MNTYEQPISMKNQSIMVRFRKKFYDTIYYDIV